MSVAKDFFVRLCHTADVFALPLWILLLAYFLKKEKLTREEKFLTAFAAIGLFCDLLFAITIRRY